MNHAYREYDIGGWRCREMPRVPIVTLPAREIRIVNEVAASPPAWAAFMQAYRELEKKGYGSQYKYDILAAVIENLAVIYGDPTKPGPAGAMEEAK